MPEKQNPSLVHVVGSVDLLQGKGEFLYVNPTRASAVTGTPAAGEAPGAGAHSPGAGFELVAQREDGSELQRWRPPVLLPSDATTSTSGLIDHTIPVVDGMARLVLLHDGRVVDTFIAGAPPPPAAAAAPPAAIAMGAAPPGGQPQKRSMSISARVEPEPGVSYTVQVRPAGEQAWQTIAVGRDTPEVVIDRNQFPGAARATVRVLRSTGFEDSLVAEDELDLGFKD